MSIGSVLAIILILMLIGGVAPWGSYRGQPNHFYGGGAALGGGIGLILMIVLILFVLGRI